jgi:uncharacterized protein (TIRG00374 family)
MGSDTPSRKKKIFLYLRIVVAMVLIVLILRLLDFKLVLKTIISTDIRYVVLILSIAIFDRYLMAYKWNILLRAKGIFLSTFEAFKILLSSGFVGILLPPTVGSDVVRAFRTKVSAGKLDQITATIVVERFIGILTVSIMAVFGFTYLAFIKKLQFNGIFVYVLVFLILFILFLVLSIQNYVYKHIKVFLSHFERFKLVRMYLEFHTAYMALSRQWKAVLIFGFLSLVRHGVIAFMNYCGARALGIPITLDYFFAIISLSSILTMLPISIDSIGVREGSYIFLFGLAGASPEEALSLSLFMRVIRWLMLIPGGLVFLYDSLKLKRT